MFRHSPAQSPGRSRELINEKVDWCTGSRRTLSGDRMHRWCHAHGKMASTRLADASV